MAGKGHQITGYFAFIVNSSRQAAGGWVSMVSATTPESAAALRERMGAVKRRMEELELEEAAKRGQSGSRPPQSLSG